MFVKKTAAAIVAAAALLSPLSPMAQDTPVANAQQEAGTQKYYQNSGESAAVSLAPPMNRLKDAS